MKILLDSILVHIIFFRSSYNTEVAKEYIDIPRYLVLCIYIADDIYKELDLGSNRNQ